MVPHGMLSILKKRIQSIDLLRGIVMVIMTLDHIRDYFSKISFSPEDPIKSNLFLFFTRWITHFSAPTFCLLVGVSAFFMSRHKAKKELSFLLITRGLWLIFVDLIVLSFGWTFNVYFNFFIWQVIAELGFGMIVLAGIIYLERIYMLIFSLVLIFFHNLLDTVHFPGSMVWSFMHEEGTFVTFYNRKISISYPIIPWIAVISLGYYIGYFYTERISPIKRKKLFNTIGILSILLFIVLRYTNIYGDPKHFQTYPRLSQDMISFFNPAKYPPSLQFLLMTLGGVFLFLANAEQLKGKIVDVFSVYGRVPFFYYVIHVYLIHLIAMVSAKILGLGWCYTIELNDYYKEVPFNLFEIYMVWIAVVISLYPLCKKFDQYKQSNKHKKWLSYL